MPNRQTEDAQHCQGKQNNLDNVTKCNLMQIQVEPSKPSCVICFGSVFLLIVQVKCGPCFKDELHSPWHYQFIIHSLYSASVRAQEDVHLWIRFVPCAIAKSIWNWISIDLHWHSLARMSLDGAPPTNLQSKSSAPAYYCGIHISLVFFLSQFHQYMLPPAIQKLHG